LSVVSNTCAVMPAPKKSELLLLYYMPRKALNHPIT
jgi:hypothetical protein